MSSQPTTPAPADRKPVPWTRIAVPVAAFILMLLWSNIPPYREHIKHEKPSYFVWHWHLFWQGGLKVCDVRYFDMNQAGAPIERWKLLGFERPGDMPDEIARVHLNTLQLDQNRVCAAMREGGDAAPNVQLWARCGVGYGWKMVSNRKRNICAAKPAKPKLPNKQPGKAPAPQPTAPAPQESE